MRKALIAVIVASALFAVGAFAAELTVNSDDVASGQDAVESCATEVQVVSYTTSQDVTATAGTADWQATGAQLKLIESTTGDCVGAEVDLAIGLDTDGSVPSNPPANQWINANDCSPTTGDPLVYDCAFAASDVRKIVQVAVLVNGDKVDAPISA